MSALDRFGVFIFPWGKTTPTHDGLAEMAQYAENLGYDSVHLPWHATAPPAFGYGNRFILDPFVILTVLAERTSRIRLALSSAIVPSYHPFILAQYLSTLDHVSRGRVIGGGAIGWWEEDFQVGGLTVNTRGAATNESLAAMTSLWEGREIVDRGKYWDVSGLIIEPRPVQRPLPFWIGGGPASIERTARWGTALFPLDMSPRYVRDELVPQLDAAAAAHGREVDLVLTTFSVVSRDDRWIDREIRPMMEKRMSHMAKEVVSGPEETTVFGHPERCAEMLQAFFDAGVDYFVFNTQFHGLESESFSREQMAQFAEEVIPMVRPPASPRQRPPLTAEPVEAAPPAADGRAPSGSRESGGSPAAPGSTATGWPASS